MFLEILQNSSLIQNLAWTLLHSVWQIALVAVLLFSALSFTSKASANLRYLFAISALILALLLPVGTFFYVSKLPFYTSNKQVITNKSFETILQAELENSEIYSADKKLISDVQNTGTVNSIGTWRNSLERNFSTYSPVLVAFWLIGMLLYSLRLFGGFWQLHRYKTQEVFSVNDEWQNRFVEICENLKIRQRVKLLKSNLVESPMVIGWIKPVILVPASVFLQMDIRQLETIITHELLHIKRFDYLVNFAQSLIEILFFYHPCIWWISTKIRQERECACDDAVLQTLENAQFTYANALANLEAFRLTAKQNKPQLNVAANGGKLMNRIERIVKKEKTKKSRFQNSLWSASLASMLILAFLVTVFWANNSLNVKQKLGWTSTNQKKIAIGFKIGSSNRLLEKDRTTAEITNILAEKLKQEKIPAVGFVEGSKFYNKDFNGSGDDFYKLLPPQIASVKIWRDAGLEVGIGSYSDLKFQETTFDDYVADAKKNIELVKPILSENNRQLRYFNYQFSKTGNNFESKNQFEQWLAEQKLRSVPTTFDNLEVFSNLYKMAEELDEPEASRKIKQDFLNSMEKIIVHYEDYSKELFGREIPQTLVLTPSNLVLDSMDEIFAIFRKHGYEFVSLEDALSDEVFNQTETYTNYEGNSWFNRQAAAKGKEIRSNWGFKPESFNIINDILRKKIEVIRKRYKKSSPNPSATPPSPPPPPPAPPKPPKPPKPPADPPPPPPAPPAPPKV